MPKRDNMHSDESDSWLAKTGKLPPPAAARFSGNIAKRFGILPVDEQGGVTVFIARQPLSEDSLAELRFVLGDLRYRFAEPSEYPEYRQFFEQLLSRLPDYPSMIIGAQCDTRPDSPSQTGRMK